MTGKWLTLFASVLFLSSQVRAEYVRAYIHNVIEGRNHILVLSATNGRTYKLPIGEKNMENFTSLRGEVLDLNISIENEEPIIKSYKRVRLSAQEKADLNNFENNDLRTVEPTDVKTVERATEVFNAMMNDGDKRRSECFKRAHIWAYDIWSKLGITTSKIFIFYTPRWQLLEKKQKWEFHVAPLITVGNVDYVLDHTLEEKPITVREWTDNLMNSDGKITCAPIKKMEEVKNGAWSRLCMTMKTPMHVLGPTDIYDAERDGKHRNSWDLEELQDARKAFENYKTVYESLDTGRKARDF